MKVVALVIEPFISLCLCLVENKEGRINLTRLYCNNRRQSQQSRLEFGLCRNRGLSGRTIFVADAHRDDGKRFVARAEEELTAFEELESAIRALTLDHPKRQS